MEGLGFDIDGRARKKGCLGKWREWMWDTEYVIFPKRDPSE